MRSMSIVSSKPMPFHVFRSLKTEKIIPEAMPPITFQNADTITPSLLQLHSHVSSAKQKEDLEPQKQTSLSPTAISALASTSRAEGLRPAGMIKPRCYPIYLLPPFCKTRGSLRRCNLS
ncbi:hypothetical protein G9A89_008003 [Geosiphon pyriformis]|nr:hypothetical protein G9A89_008003 [Geosiphon pyriformis]